MTSEVMDTVLAPLNTDPRKVLVIRARFSNGGHPKMRRTKSIVIVLISLMAFIPSQAQAKDTSVVDTIKQLEQDMGNAMVAGDIEKHNQIYADDWATVGSCSKVITKETLLSDFKSFHDKLEWFENGPMDVQVFGNVAVACASVKEKRTRDGKDTSGEFVWVDLLEKRAGKWVVVRTAGARLK
jgi:ketosteroid isomerase-like protein